MKNIKTLLILFSSVLLLSSKCNKKNNEPGILKGRLMVNCTTPYANKLVKVQTYIGLSAPHLEDADGNTEFYTNADGYFEIKYFTKAFEGVLYAPHKTMSFIPLGSGQNLDLGEVNLNGRINYYVKLQVNNPYSANDTLVYGDLVNLVEKRLPGPFQSGVIDSFFNVQYISYPIKYNEVPKQNLNFGIYPYVSGASNSISVSVPFCSSAYSEAVFVIN